MCDDAGIINYYLFHLFIIFFAALSANRDVDVAVYESFAIKGIGLISYIPGRVSVVSLTISTVNRQGSLLFLW